MNTGQPKLLRTLRIKFILMNMLLAAVVLVLAFGTVCYLDYMNRLSTVYEELDVVLADVAEPDVPQIDSIRPLSGADAGAGGAGAAAGVGGGAADGGVGAAGAGGVGGQTVGAGGAASVVGGAPAGAAGAADGQTDGQGARAGAGSTDDADGDSADGDAADVDADGDVVDAGAGSGADGDDAGDGGADGNAGDGGAGGNDEVGEGGNKDGSRVEFTAPMIGKSPDKNAVVLVAVYSVTPSGIYTVVGDYTTATIPESVILRANEIVLDSSKSRGYISEFNLYYERITSPGNPRDTIVAYADGTSVSGWTSLAATLVLVGIAGLVALFFINIFFSRWALRPVKISIEQQQQFTADASHELKTPLTVILANMAILKGQPDSTVKSQMQWIDSTHTEAERMQLLVNDMLELSKPDGQKAQFTFEEVDLSDLVEGEALQFESVAFELGVELESEIDEGLTVEGDHDRLARMVATLIDNACKYASAEEDADGSGGVDAHDDEGAGAGGVAGADGDNAGEDDVAGAGDTGTDADGVADAGADGVASASGASDECTSADGAADAGSVADADATGTADVDAAEDDADGAESAGAAASPCVVVALTRRDVAGMRPDEAVLTVHNDGPSIPEEDIPHIFNRFYRADKARTSSKGGYGLGLAIGQEIAHEHNGSITVESTPATGTTFTVTLPLSN